MLHAKFRGDRTIGFGEDEFLRDFTIYVTVPGILSLMKVYGRNSDFYIL